MHQEQTFGFLLVIKKPIPGCFGGFYVKKQQQLCSCVAFVPREVQRALLLIEYFPAVSNLLYFSNSIRETGHLTNKVASTTPVENLKQ